MGMHVGAELCYGLALEQDWLEAHVDEDGELQFEHDGSLDGTGLSIAWGGEWDWDIWDQVPMLRLDAASAGCYAEAASEVDLGALTEAVDASDPDAIQGKLDELELGLYWERAGWYLVASRG